MRRLRDEESPLLVQEEFMKSIGVEEVSRRGRLAIDPEFKYILRFFIGPSEVARSGQASRSGTVEILKGHVFPQWMRRSVAIVGSRLIVYPGEFPSTCIRSRLIAFNQEKEAQLNDQPATKWPNDRLHAIQSR